MLTKQYIDDHQVIERYLADQLTDVEREEFESYYVEHPEILEDLQAAAGIKLGAALLRRSGELQKLTARPRWARWRSGLALAASLLVVITGAYLLRPGTQPTMIMAASLGDFPSTLATADIYQVQRTRSEVDAVVVLPDRPEALTLRVRAAIEPPPASYQMQLAAIAEDETQTAIASLTGLRLDGEGFITVYLNSATLQPGMYQLNVSDEAAGAAATPNEFLIEVVTGDAAQSNRR